MRKPSLRHQSLVVAAAGSRRDSARCIGVGHDGRGGSVECRPCCRLGVHVTGQTMIKLGIILFLGFIVYNLGVGCWYMLTERSDSTRAVKALSWRIGLSILLIGLIGLGLATGVVKPHGILN